MHTYTQLEMISLYRAPVSEGNGLFLSKLPILGSLQVFSALQCEPLSKLSHLIAEPRSQKSSIVRLDRSVDRNVAQANWMITKMSREGKIDEARKMFDKMADPDVITWTTVISAYIKCGMMGEARRLFDRVDAKKNVVTWTAIISGYLRMNQISEAEGLFNEMPEKNVVSYNTMIDGYVKSGRIEEALGLFERMPERSVVSWNTIVSGLFQSGRIEEARDFFSRMPERDVISWTAMVAGLSKYGKVDEARVLFDTMPKRSIVSWNAMITGYAQNLRLDDAYFLFEKMPEKDVPSWNTMISGFIQNGDLRMARKLFDDIPQKNTISWTTVITGYVQDGQSEEALNIFSKMQASEEVKPNEATYVVVLGACSNLAGLDEGQQIHQVISKTVYQNCAYVVSALINMYSKCGELVTSRKLFDDGLKTERDLVGWNVMIAAYAHHGCGKEAIDLFKEMQNFGIKPNDVTYVGLLAACSHSGLVDEGLKYFKDLVSDSSIQLREDHYTCLVDLCGRAGRLKEAYDFIEHLPTASTTSILGALLSSCNVHGDASIGKLAQKKLSELDPSNAGTYTLLSNIYASSGKWREAANMRLKMKDKGLKKQPGCSWIEVGNRVHIFIAGDKFHSENNLIHSLLDNLYVKMRKASYIPTEDITVA